MEDNPFKRDVPVLFKKFKVLEKIGQGAFGAVYKGKNIQNNKLVAIKVEKLNITRPSVESEGYILASIKGTGIPELLSLGKVKTYTVLVEPLLGQNLFDIFIQKGKQFALEEMCMIAIQVLDRIQLVHSHYIIHRDIKPDNFLIGREDPNIIYLVDFGLSKKYRSSTTKRHVQFRNTGKLTGTIRFSSPNALRGGEQSRKDDLISIGYMIIYFMRKKLPWQLINIENEMDRYIAIYRMKKNIKPEELCRFLPDEMAEYMRYVQNLKFEDNPDYKYLKGLFKSILIKMDKNYDKLLFSWIKVTDIPNLKKPVNPSSRRSGSRERLWKKINDNLNEKKRGTSSDSSENNSYEIVSNVKINSPNVQTIRNNSKENFDVSNIGTEINSKIRNNINTLIVNFDKTINNQLIASIENIDNQIESKDTSNNYQKNIEISEEQRKKIDNKEKDIISPKNEIQTNQLETDNNLKNKEINKQIMNNDNFKEELQIKNKKENNLNNNIDIENNTKKNILINDEIKNIINKQSNNNKILISKENNNITPIKEKDIIPIIQNTNIINNNGIKPQNNKNENKIKPNKNDKNILNSGKKSKNKNHINNKNINQINLNKINNPNQNADFQGFNNINKYKQNNHFNNNYYINYTEPSDTKLENKFKIRRNETDQYNRKNNLFNQFNNNYNFNPILENQTKLKRNMNLQNINYIRQTNNIGEATNYQYNLRMNNNYIPNNTFENEVNSNRNYHILNNYQIQNKIKKQKNRGINHNEPNIHFNIQNNNFNNIIFDNNTNNTPLGAQYPNYLNNNEQLKIKENYDNFIPFPGDTQF